MEEYTTSFHVCIIHHVAFEIRPELRGMRRWRIIGKIRILFDMYGVPSVAKRGILFA